MGLSSPKLLLDNGDEFLGHSHQMRSVFQVIQRLGNVNTSVLIRGENGTGKELVARAIHFNSPRKDKPFVAINCGAIAENLIESEFFGHEKGAFTGADQRHIGKFQYAEGGTLFLDEIGDISLAMQVKLLRVLQERRFTPVGSNREIRSDVRVVAATNRNLEEMIRKGDFREDFFYRLNVMPIELPPLRDRSDDIPILVEHFIEKFNALHGRMGTGNEIRGIREDALNALKNYSWPGNIRELENVVERAFVLENSLYLHLGSLPPKLHPRPERAAGASLHPGSGSSGHGADPSVQVIDFHNQKEQFERQFIITALRRFGGRINQTVAHAGIPKNTLLRKIRKYEINPTEYGPVDQDGEERS
jgi:DNA-binding NtrC family response regulator